MKVVLGPYRGRIIALMLLFSSIAIIAYVVMEAVAGLHKHYDSAIESASDRLARYRRVIEMGPAVQARIDDVKRKDGIGYYLKSASPALAAEEIQQLAQTIFDASGLKLESTQIAPHQDEGQYRKVVVNYKLKGTHLLVEKLFYMLENNPKPLLFVDNISIQSSVFKAFPPMPGVEPEAMIQFDLYGYALVKKPAEKKK